MASTRWELTRRAAESGKGYVARKSRDTLCTSVDAWRMAGMVASRVAMAPWFAIRMFGLDDALESIF